MNTDEGSRRVVDLLMEALELEGAERQKLVEEVGAEDPELRRELEELLAEEELLDEQFLEVPAVANLSDTPPFGEQQTLAIPPKKLGPYKVLDVLGRGGMGVVYLGEQGKPIRRKVALKVIDAIHDPERLKRFAAECQALARLSHPNIASLYEVGTTDDDHPFVAMELVDGITINKFCDEHHLDLHQRIRLFFGVCAGVRHAHEKGLLHRDIKPSNILVTEIDGKPVAKVIDFGIARAVDEPLITDVRTLTHQILGSPGYMSPEAARFGQHELDTRSDVYSLGVVLYELLVGHLPFETEGEALFTVMTRLFEKDPPAPSLRFADLDRDRRRQLAEKRQLSASRLLGRLRGDLDAIVLKAIARDRDQRYSSPGDFVKDLESYLDQAPITARSSSPAYRLQYILRRNPQIVAALALIFVALAVGMLTRTYEARRANLESQQAVAAQMEAEAVADFLTELFEVTDHELLPNASVDARGLLDRGAERLRDRFKDQPLVRARLLQTLGDLQLGMSNVDTAETLITEALALRNAELDEEHPAVLESKGSLGAIYRRQDRLDDAETMLREVVAAREAAAEPDPKAIARALHDLGSVLWSERRLDEAESILRQALTIRERELGNEHQDVAESLDTLGAIITDQRRPEDAEPLLQRAVDIFARTLGEDHPRRAESLDRLALLEDDLGQWSEAESHLRQALATWKATFGAEHPRTLMAQANLGELLTTLGREAESVDVLGDLLAVQEKIGTDERVVASTSTSLGLALAAVDRFDAAQKTFERSLVIYRSVFGEEHDSTLGARANLAWLAWRRGRSSAAERQFRDILDARRQLLGDEHPRTAWTLHYLAAAVAARGRDDEAESLFQEALNIRTAALGDSHRDVGCTLLELGELARRRGQAEEAHKLLRRAHQIYAATLPPDHRDLAQTATALAALGES